LFGLLLGHWVVIMFTLPIDIKAGFWVILFL